MSLTVNSLANLPFGFEVTATDIAALSGQNRVKGIHPLLHRRPKAVAILCTIKDGDYPDRWLDKEHNNLLYCLEGRLDRTTGKKVYGRHFKSNQSISGSAQGDYPVHVFWRSQPKGVFQYAGPFTFVDYQDVKGGHVAFHLGRLTVAGEKKVEPPLLPLELRKTDAPPPPTPTGKVHRAKVGKHDYNSEAQKAKAVGTAGEELVLHDERQKWAHLPDVNEKVKHIANDDDGAGYDILSLKDDLSPKLIEVKTTTGGINTPFFLSTNEVNVSKQQPADYVLVRIYEFDPQRKAGRYYTVNGDLEHALDLEPIQFRAMPK